MLGLFARRDQGRLLMVFVSLYESITTRFFKKRFQDQKLLFSAYTNQLQIDFLNAQNLIL
jgi:hypothetical protein